MDIGDLMQGIAERIDAKKGALGLEGVSYPALNHVPKSPWLMVRQSVTAPTMITKARAGMQVVAPAIDLVVLVASDPKYPGDAARLDTLVHPLLDLFDANANGGNVNSAFSGILTENVDRVWNEAMVRRVATEWGESGYCHALIITMDAQFMRKAEMPT